MIGGTALVYPHILGVGYEATDAALQENLPLALLAILIGVKLLATAFSLGGGFGGGVFSPSLFLGAMTGGTFGFMRLSAWAPWPALCSARQSPPF